MLYLRFQNQYPEQDQKIINYMSQYAPVCLLCAVSITFNLPASKFLLHYDYSQKNCQYIMNCQFSLAVVYDAHTKIKKLKKCLRNILQILLT